MNFLWRICCMVSVFISSSLSQKTSSGFDCEGRTTGYYADIQSGCQIYHMCDNIGRRFTYACPNNTLFQQRMLICDHWYMVDCSNAERFYSANLRIGQKGPFVEEGEMDGMRTTRPDLLTATNDHPERNRDNRDQTFTPKNTVGLKSKPEDEAYVLPSFWSTENTPRSSVQPFGSQRGNTHSQLSSDYTRYNVVDEAVERNKAKSIDFSSSKSGNAFFNNDLKSKSVEQIHINYKSNFKATTPIYPSTVDDTTSSPNNIGLEPPAQNSRTQQDNEKRINPGDPLPEPEIRNSPNRRTDISQQFIKGLGRVNVNFESNFKATTPVYPTFVDSTSVNPDDAGVLPPKDIQRNQAIPDRIINFVSHFKATTPVYPHFVESTSSNPEEVGLLAPKNEQNSIEQLVDIVNFASNFKATTPVYPLTVESTSQNPEEVGILGPKGEQDIAEGSQENVNFASNYKATTPEYPNEVESTSPNPEEVGLLAPKNIQNGKESSANNLVNFPSNYKATTPVYPSSVDSTSPNPKEVGLIAPNFTQNSDDRTVKNHINFASSYKATTPVYPSSVDSTSPNPKEVGLIAPNITENNEDRAVENHINFASNYKATTPVYPSSVDPTSPNPKEVGLIAPNVAENSEDRAVENHINFASNYKATTPVYPSSVDPTSPNPKEVGLIAPNVAENSEDRAVENHINFASNYKATTPVYPNSVDPTSPNPNEVGLLAPNRIQNNQRIEDRSENHDRPVVNFVSNFKATTPVYPITVEQTSPLPEELGLLPPKPNQQQKPLINFSSTFSATTPVYSDPIKLSLARDDTDLLPPRIDEILNKPIKMNFFSKFKATTPVYPTKVDPTSPNPIDLGLLPPELAHNIGGNVNHQSKINFVSNYKATTPVYPDSVDNSKKEEPLQEEYSLPNIDLLPPRFDENYKLDSARIHETTISTPARFYQPPEYEPDFTDENPGLKIVNFMKSFNVSQWQELRTVFRIPEYDFPLDDATRPSYDSVFDSFDAKSIKKK